MFGDRLEIRRVVDRPKPENLKRDGETLGSGARHPEVQNLRSVHMTTLIIDGRIGVVTSLAPHDRISRRPVLRRGAMKMSRRQSAGKPLGARAPVKAFPGQTCLAVNRLIECSRIG